METIMNGYALGHSQHEYRRLVRQGELLKPMTRRTLSDAGIESGMRVLDLGSGIGDVSMLLAEMTGPTGCVIGLEVDAGAVKFAEERVYTAGLRNIMFVPVEFSDYTPDRTVDAIVGRGVLLYQPDPATALARISRHLRPGGVVAFMEPWLALPQGPEAPMRRVATCIVETLRRSGAHIDLGPRLHKVFTSAGLPRPSMRYKAVMDSRDDSPLYQLVADSYFSLLPKAIEYGIAAVDDADIEKIPAQLRAFMNASGYAPMLLPTVCAWCKTAKP